MQLSDTKLRMQSYLFLMMQFYLMLLIPNDAILSNVTYS